MRLPRPRRLFRPVHDLAWLGIGAIAFLLCLAGIGCRAEEDVAGVDGPLRYASPGDILDHDAAPPDIRPFYQQLHAPPYPRDIAAMRTTVVPPWLLASADGEPRPTRIAHAILPSEADAEIREFLAKNLVLLDANGAGDAPLLVWMSGTGGTPLDAGLFLPAAADAGYRVIGLEFDSLPAGTEICGADADRSCFTRYRTARVWGGDAMPALRGPAAESIVRRLTRLLLLLRTRFPNEHWERYLQGSEPAWSRIVLSGQSMGSGMAAFLAKQRRVAGVILSSSPWDHQSPNGELAPWLAEPSATPRDRWLGIYHARETMAPVLGRAYAALGLDAAHIMVSHLTPLALTEAPPLSMVFHGCWFGAAIPLDKAWRPTADLKNTWSFLLSRNLAN